MSASTAADPHHDHMWRIAEIEFIDSHTLDRYECVCGAIDFVYSS